MKRNTRKSVAQRPERSPEGLVELSVSKTQNGQWAGVICILQVTVIGQSAVSFE